ncbi:MAG: ArnT family glycosyltransferase, partial [Caulobacteraceae bacterium]
LGSPQDAADAIADGDPAIVEKRSETPFEAALADDEAHARLIGQVAGLDYSNGRHDILRLYAPAEEGGSAP